MEKNVALIIVDVQNCFMPWDVLPVPGGDEVVPVFNRYIKLFNRHGLPIYATRDWHPEVTHHFKEYGGQWPPHCIQGTEGAKFHADLELLDDVEIVSAGMDPNTEGYSSFEGTNEQGVSLEESLRKRGVKHLYLGGLATDYCVKFTSLDALQRGFRVTLLADAVRGVEVQPGDSQRAIEAMIRAGARIGNYKDVEEEFGGVGGVGKR
ncbi:MAG: nicotinamidase [Armatimonadetes bacterium]|nr:nicotinamidase [Armatimonadota bacterium]